MGLGVVFFIFILLGVYWNSWMFKLRLFTKHGTFLIIISSNSFFLSHYSLFPLPPEFLLYICRPLVIISQVTKAVDIFQYYFPVFQMRWFLLVSFQVHQHFLVLSLIHLQPNPVDFLAGPRSMQSLSSVTRDWEHGVLRTGPPGNSHIQWILKLYF